MILIALTGSILVFKHEIDVLLTPNQVQVEPQDGRLDQDIMMAGVHGQLPDYHLVGWALFEDPARADVLFLMRNDTNIWQKAFLNGFTGELLSEPHGLEEGLTDWVLSLHYTFLGGHLGMLVVGILALAMCLLGATGIWIYKRFWINLFSLNWKNRRVLMGDFHRKVGIFSSPVFFILGLTGAWWNLTHAITDLAAHGLGDEDPVLSKRYYGPDVSLDEIFAKANSGIEGFRTHYIAFPRDEESPIALYGQVSEKGMLRSQYGMVQSFDRLSGEAGSVYDIREGHPVEQMLDSFRPLHFGDFGGLLSRLIWCLLGLSPGVLAMSGFIVYLERNKKKSKQKKTSEHLEESKKRTSKKLARPAKSGNCGGACAGCLKTKYFK